MAERRYEAASHTLLPECLLRPICVRSSSVRLWRITAVAAAGFPARLPAGSGPLLNCESVDHGVIKLDAGRPNGAGRRSSSRRPRVVTSTVVKAWQVARDKGRYHVSLFTRFRLLNSVAVGVDSSIRGILLLW